MSLLSQLTLRHAGWLLMTRPAASGRADVPATPLDDTTDDHGAGGHGLVDQAKMLTLGLLADQCDGCHACFKACPVDAISGAPKELHVIHHDACISCGACFDVCPDQAIETFPKTELIAREVV